MPSAGTGSRSWQRPGDGDRGRPIHPVSPRPGGFHRIIRREELTPLLDSLKRAREESLATVKFAASLDFPDFERDYEFVCLRHPDEYPMNEGRIVSSKGIDIPVSEFTEHLLEVHSPLERAAVG